MTDKELQSLSLWLIEELLELNRRLDGINDVLRTLLTSASLLPETRKRLEAMLASDQPDGLIRVLSQAADSIRQKTETVIREGKE